MVIEEIKNTKSKTSEFRKFGVTMAVVLALIGGLILWRHKNYYWYLFGAAALFLLLGLLAPSMLKSAHKIWMTLSIIMGGFMSRLILIILFYLVLTPTGLLLRILGKDILNTRITKDSSESYWIPRKTNKSQERDYEKQF